MDFIFAAGGGKKEKRKTKREREGEGGKEEKKHYLQKGNKKGVCVGLSAVACVYQITQFKLACPMA